MDKVDYIEIGDMLEYRSLHGISKVGPVITIRQLPGGKRIVLISGMWKSAPEVLEMHRILAVYRDGSQVIRWLE
jgi:hypothetical protein